LAETSKQYARTVLQIAAQRWERENGLMVRDAIAAAIAHELRQPLAAIRMNVQTVQRRLAKSDDDTAATLDEIVTASDRANDIIASTRAMFGKSDAQRSPATMSHLIRDTIAMVSRDLRQQGIAVELRLDDALPPIAVNRLQLQQVFYNLVMNAAEAMRQVVDRPRILTIRSASSGDGIVIRVEDTGPGIAAADRERIFETFYTTKHHGTGLGLAICRSVITAHGGQLRAVMGEPVGAVFEIQLPYAPETEIQAG